MQSILQSEPAEARAEDQRQHDHDDPDGHRDARNDDGITRLDAPVFTFGILDVVDHDDRHDGAKRCANRVALCEPRPKEQKGGHAICASVCIPCRIFARLGYLQRGSNSFAMVPGIDRPDERDDGSHLYFGCSGVARRGRPLPTVTPQTGVFKTLSASTRVPDA